MLTSLRRCAGLTVVLAVVGLLAFCVIVITLITIMWWAPIG